MSHALRPLGYKKYCPESFLSTIELTFKLCKAINMATFLLLEALIRAIHAFYFGRIRMAHMNRFLNKGIRINAHTFGKKTNRLFLELSLFEFHKLNSKKLN